MALAHLMGSGYTWVMATTNRRRLSAIFFSDMKGFSRAMDEDEDATLDLLRDHNRIMDEQVARHSGRVVKTVGDAYMVEFDSSVDAVACALDCQRAIEQYNEDHDGLIEIRIGVHAGDVVIEGDDVFGEAVNIAARLEPQAPVGGVCISEVVYTQVRKRVHATGVDMGRVSLKNISEPMQLYAIVPGSEHLQIAGTPRTRVVTSPAIGGPGLSRALILGLVAVVCVGVGLWQVLGGGPGPSAPEGDVTAANTSGDGTAEDEAAGPARGGVLRVAGLYPFAGDWDLYPEIYLPHHNLVDVVAETLVFWGVAGELHPGPLESWEVGQDGLSVSLSLRDGVHFHDHPCLPGGRGRAATAADLAWSLITSKRAQFTFFVLDGDAPGGGVDVSDERVLRLTLAQPWPYMQRELHGVRLLPRDLEGCQSPSGMKHLAGTGPFYLDRVTPNGGVVLKRNPRYWAQDEQGGGLPYLDGVEWVPLTDRNRLIEELQAGRLHLSLAPPEVLEFYWDEPHRPVPRLKSEYAELKVQVGNVPKHEHESELLTLEPILRDGGPMGSRDVRLALSHAIRRADLPLAERHWEPRRRLLDAYTLGAEVNYEGSVEDLGAAAAALERVREAGGGAVPEIVLASVDSERAIADAIAEQVTAAGLPVRVVKWERWVETDGESVQDSMDMVLRHFWLSRHGAELCGLPLRVVAEGAEHGWSAGGTLENIASRILASRDPEERGRLYAQLERGLIDEDHIIPIAVPDARDMDYRLLTTDTLQGAFTDVTRMLIRYPTSHFTRWWLRQEPD